MRRFTTGGFALLAFLVLAGSALGSIDRSRRSDWPLGTVVVSYASRADLDRALARQPARVVRSVPTLRVAAVRPAGDAALYAAAVAGEPGIVRVESASARRSFVEPALGVPVGASGSYQWQYAAIGADRVPPQVARAAASLTIAVIDTGADLAAPDLAAKAPLAWSVRRGDPDVADLNGHGTFVAALAAGSGSNGDGIAGVGGDARLLVVQAGGPTGTFTDVDEAAAIVWAVDHGAKILNLSLGGATTSTTERRAIDYAVSKGALLVAAVGNGRKLGNPVEYPAALLQPVGSRGAGGRGLAVAASTRTGESAAFSGTGTHVSLAAPGESVFSAVSSSSPTRRYPRTPLPGSAAGVYGYASGTSFAAPQVAGAAALVWAAAPQLRASEVASILEETASGRGTWSADLGFGVVDVAAAVARAQAGPAGALRIEGRRAGNSRVELSWPALPGATAYRVTVAEDSAPGRPLGSTAQTSASFAVTPGSDYAFAVTALDAAGAQLAASEPWTISLRQVATRLSLRARRLGPGGASVSIVARLSATGGLSVRRPVVLESFDGARWSRAGSAVTDRQGVARWRFSLERGSYRLRARFAGTEELLAATSSPVRLRLR